MESFFFKIVHFLCMQMATILAILRMSFHTLDLRGCLGGVVIACVKGRVRVV